MKGPFPKMAFWKTNEPPKSELAARSKTPLSPPSRTAEIIDSTAHAGPEYAENNAGSSSPSAYNRTQPYSYERPGSNPLEGVQPASAFTANNTPNGGGNLNGFGQPAGGLGDSYENRAANLSANANAGQIPNSFGTSPAEVELPGRYPTRSSNVPDQSISQTPSYPSTNFASFSPKASTAALESNLDASEENAVSQVSSNSSLSPPPAARKSLPPSVPVSALNRQGSYAPGSTGSSAKPVNASGFNPNFGTPSTGQGACPGGCNCDKCKTPSAGGDFQPGFYGN